MALMKTYYYHAGTNGVRSHCFDGIEYTAFPIEVDGFEKTAGRCSVHL